MLTDKVLAHPLEQVIVTGECTDIDAWRFKAKKSRVLLLKNDVHDEKLVD